MHNISPPRSVTRRLGLLTAAATIAAVLVGQAAPKSSTSTMPNDDAAIRHALGRLGYGSRPGEVERVRAMGLAKWIEQQLRPERIDDRALDGRLARFETLQLSARDIARDYYMPVLMERRDRRQDSAAGASPAEGTTVERMPATDAQRKARQVISDLSEQKILRAVYSERQLEEVMTDFWFNHFNVFAGKNAVRSYVTEYERDAIRPHALGTFRDLLGATAKSPAMLVYLDNWLSMDPNAPDRARRLQPEAPRMPRRSGRVRPGRTAPAESAPMPGTPDPVGPTAPTKVKPPQKRGINENYARELMELHTLGVDGGYAQQDIVEVARAFTGWTVQDPRQGGGFLFRPAWHDDRGKHVLGRRIADGGGMRDGEQVLDLLAAHPSTAKFIATKLARRFVSDTPPESLVVRAAARFSETDGDIREVVRTIVTSPEFFDESARRAKVKTPLEFVASALRTTGATVSDARVIALKLRDMGMPLYFAQPPTGYKDASDAWVNSGALLTRMNFALALVDDKVPGVAVDLARLGIDGRGADDSRQDLVERWLGGEVATTTRAAVSRGSASSQVAALVLGSPEFQRR